MRHPLQILPLLALTALVAPGCETPIALPASLPGRSPAPAPAEPVPLALLEVTGRLPFWEITGVESAGVEITSVESTVVETPGPEAARAPAALHLLGSVYLGDEPVSLDRVIVDAFLAAETVAVAIDVEEATPENMFELLKQYGVKADGEPIDQMLDRRTVKLLDDFLAERGASLGQFRFMEPWVVLTVVTSMIHAEAGLTRTASIDSILTERALESGKEIISLETLESQFALLDALPTKLQDRMLRALLEDPEASLEADELVDAWQLGDLDTIEARALGPLQRDKELAAFQDKVFFARNRAMAERLASLAAEGRPLFVIVGVPHLVGDRGIPALLGARGFDVRQLDRSPPQPEEEP